MHAVTAAATTMVLLLVLQAPALRPIVKHAGTLAPVLSIAVPLAATILYARLDRLPLPPWRIGAGLVLAAVVAVAVLVYPEADALKAAGRGSDQDDGLIQAAMALIAGTDPYGAPSYLGLPLSAGPGLVLIAVPFVAAGFYPGLTVGALALMLALLARRYGAPAAGRAAILLATSLSFWELVAIGSDLIAVGALAVAVGVAIDLVRGRLARLALALAGGAVATARIVFLGLPPLWALAWLKGRPGPAAAFAGAGLVAALLLHLAFAALADRPYPPLHLLGKGGDLMAGGRAYAAVVAAAGIAAALAAAICGKPLAALAFGLSGPLGAVALAHLAAVGWTVALWSGASYLGAAMPAVAAWAAVGAARAAAAGPETAPQRPT